MKPKTLTIHKDVWASWQTKANKVSDSTAYAEENYIHFKEEPREWVFYDCELNGLFVMRTYDPKTICDGYGAVLLGVL